MRLIINEKEYEYHSDYPDGWEFSSGDYFKHPVQIGKHNCFIKRFEIKRPTDLPGWDLLVRLKYKNEKNLPRIYDIISVEEKRKQIHYVFYEYIKGTRLDHFIESEAPVDLRRLTVDLFNSFDSIHKYDYWFADFCEKNIFREEKGRFLLLDLDSCQPVGSAPDNGMKVNMAYWAPVYEFYRKILNISELRLSDIPGVSLNHLQSIFLILHLKIYSLNNRFEYMSGDSFRELPAALDRVDPSFRELFIQVLHTARGSGEPYSVDDIKALILEKIIPLEEWPPHSAEPEIVRFESNLTEVKKGQSFELSWDVNNATQVKIFRNDAEFQVLDADQKSFTVRESYDGRDREIAYSLGAFNERSETRSGKVVVAIREMIISPAPDDARPSQTPVVPAQPAVYPVEKKNLAGIRMALGGLAAAVLIALGVILFFMFRDNDVAIRDFAPREVEEEHTIVLSGENFPTDSNRIQVLFNNVKGVIRFVSENTIRVSVPVMGEQKGDGTVKIGVVVGGDTAFAPSNLLVKTNVLPPVVIPVTDEAATVAADSQVVTTAPPVTKTVTKKPVVVDSQPVVSIPLPVDKPAPKKDKVNIYEHVTVNQNDDYKRKFLGGIKHLKVTVNNNSPYILDNVVVEISVLKKNDKQIEKEFMNFENVRPNASLTKDAPHFSRGAKVNLRITSITSKELVNIQGSGY